MSQPIDLDRWHLAADRVARLAARALSAPAVLVAARRAGGLEWVGAVGLPRPPLSEGDPLLARAMTATTPIAVTPDGKGAGAALRAAIGDSFCLVTRVGETAALVVADRAERTFDDADALMLRDLALMAATALGEDGDGERALQDAERRWLDLAENVDEIVFRANASLGFTYLSAGWRDAMGYTPAETLGSSVLSYVHPEDRARALEGLLTLVEGRQETVELQARWLAKSSGARRTRVRARAERDADGTVVGVSGTLADTTQKSALEEQLRQAQKFEAVGRLAGGVAHDFNNLLTAIRGYADLLHAELPEKDTRRADADEIRRLTDRAATLTRHLLSFSRTQVMPPSGLDLGAVVTDLRGRLREELGAGIELVTRSGPAFGAVRVDRALVERILSLLVQRARRAMANGGRLTVETSSVAMRERYADDQMVLAPGRYLTIAVGDTGPALDATAQERLFEPGHDGRSAEGGLGLATVYGLVKQAGGHLWVYSEPGHGTTFKIYLPVSDAQAARQSPSSGLMARNAGTVLLVEDDDQLRTMARRTLASHGYAVLEAAHGRAALDRAAMHDGHIDILVTDVVMPVMAGRELAETLLAAQPDLRVLYMSGFSDGDIVQRGLLGPNEGFLQKPFAPDALVHRVRALLESV